MKKMLIFLIVLITGVRFCAYASDKFDRFGGWTGIQGEKKGYFHTQNINGRWWLVTPEGNVFWSTGMYCVRMSGIAETGTGRKPYAEACLAKYGNETEWANSTVLKLHKWGFNTIGDWSSDKTYRGQGLAYVIGFNLPRKSENIIPKGQYGYFPDVFSQEFSDSIKERYEKIFKEQPYLIDDPWLIGYFVADEPSWYGSRQRRGALSDDFIALNQSQPGKKAWIDFIKSKHVDIKDLNVSWGTNYQSFDELLNLSKIKDDPNSELDKIAFLQVIAERFSQVLAETLRSYDKYHLILGSRPSRLYPEVIKGIGKYCDVFAAGAYGLNQGYHIDPSFDKAIDEIYEYSGKPILLGVLIAGQDAGLPHGIVRTQKDRGVSYWRYLAKIASNPNVVGVHWFQYFDPPVHCYDAEAANWGLVNEKDEPYEDAVQLIAQANKMVYAYATGLTDFMPEFDSFLGLKKEETPKNIQGPLKHIPIKIANPGFEPGGKDWALQTWKGKSKASTDLFQKHSGLSSLKIEGGTDEGWGSVGVGVQGKPQFTLKSGYQYRLSAWIKTKDVENSAFVRIKVKYLSGQDAYFATEGAYGTGDWKQVEVRFSPREENTVEYLGVQLVGKGTAWFDDLQLEVAE